MEVEYTVNPEDIVALHNYSSQHPSKSVRRTRRGTWRHVLYLAFLTAIFFGGAIWAEYDKARQPNKPRTMHPGHLLALLTLGSGVTVMFVPVFWLAVLERTTALRRLRESLQQGRYNKFLGRHRISLTSEAFTCANEMSTEILKWKAMERIIVTGSHALFFVSEAAAYILPKRSFECEADFCSLVETARDYLEAAQKSKFTAKTSSEAIHPAEFGDTFPITRNL